MITRRHVLTATATLPLLPSLAWAIDDPMLLAQLPYGFEPRHVTMQSDLAPGVIHVVPDQYTLYWTLPDRQAIRYYIGVGRDQLYEPGVYVIRAKKEWPRWTPTPGMIEREPELYLEHKDGMDGGPGNPLGARALYLYDGPRDTYLRIHGTDRPDTIGQDVSNGCARLVDGQIIDLYERVPVETEVYMYEKGILPPII